MHRFIVGLVAITAVSVFSMHQTASTQGNGLNTAKVTHIGVVVSDIDAAVREYGRIMGFKPPQVNTYPLPLPDGGKVEIKVATFNMPNFGIEVIQPLSAQGPYQEHLKAFGTSIQHVGLMVPGPGSIDEVRSALEQQGGRWTLGAKGLNYAFVNFQPTLGTSLEVNRGGVPAGATAMAPAPGDALPPLASLNATHVGFAATNTANVVGGFAKALGIAPPKVMEYKDSQYPPESKWDRSAFLRLAFWDQGGTGMEVIESVGSPTPWSDFVTKQKGTAAQHLAINVGDKMDETIRDLVAKGGKWTNGKPGGNYAYLDFMDKLGLIFELNGTSKSAPPAKK
jgi:catechol 2,3-dioxygenase-like lactoylglutathione lyase family enzyme